MYLINNPIKNIKTITLLLICFISFNASANDVPDALETTGYAEQGHAFAQYNLAVMYSMGQGVIQSNDNSYIWNAIAAVNGHEGAIHNRDIIAKNLSPSGLEEAQEEAAKLYETINNK